VKIWCNSFFNDSEQNEQRDNSQQPRLRQILEEDVGPEDDDPQDCNEGIPFYSLVRSNHRLKQDDLCGLPDHHLQLASSLYLQPCDEIHWLICNPLEGGYITAIDSELRELLDAFSL
jgi:hypothetical protein